MKSKLISILLLLPLPLAAATPAFDSIQTSNTMKWGVTGLCFMIAILRQSSSLALEGNMNLNWIHILARLIFVVFFVHYAGSIQGYIWSSGKAIGDSYTTGSTIMEVNSALSSRIKAKKEQSAQMESSSDVFDGAIGGKVLSTLANLSIQLVEHISVTIFFVIYKFLISAQTCIMLFLGAMAPILIPPSIIPGVNTWSSWLKMVASTALWPVVAGFMIKGHFMTSSSLAADPSQVFSNSMSNAFLNMDALGLFAESLIYAFLILSSPVIAASIVYGSAHVLGSGASSMMSGGAMAATSALSKTSRFGGAK